MSRLWVQRQQRAFISSGDLLGSFQGKHSVLQCIRASPLDDAVWNTCTVAQVSALECLQNYAARVILGRRRDVSATAMRCELGWPTLASRRKLSEVTAVFHCFSGHSPPSPYLSAHFKPSSQVHQHETRSSTSKGLLIPHSCTNHRKKSFAFRGSKSWNALPSRLRDIKNLDTFATAARNIYYLTPYELLHAIPN